MVWYFKVFGYSWLGKYFFLAQNNFFLAPTLSINNDRPPRRLHTLGD